MRVFKCALKLVLRRPVYFLIYGLWLSFMGVFMASSLAAPSETAGYTPLEMDYAVIDRDDSAVAEGIEAFLENQGTQVTLEDTPFAIQDAVAKGTVDYVLIIPEGYEDALLKAAATDAPAPEMECVYSYYSAVGALADAALSEYISSLSAYAALMPNASVDEIVKLTREAMGATATIEMIEESNTDGAEQIVFYLQFDMYVYFAGIIVCVGIMLTALNRTDVRRRNLASPVGYLAYNGQTALASVVVMLVFCALTWVLGLAFFGESFAAVTPTGKLLMALTTIVFACVPLSCAFLFGQLGMGETMLNALGNIIGLVLSFLGGAWIPMELVGPEVLALAHFLPGYWYTDALSQAGSMGAADGAAIAAIGCDIGILALFAAAIFAVALVVGRLRTQTAEAGGNAAAEPAAV